MTICLSSYKGHLVDIRMVPSLLTKLRCHPKCPWARPASLSSCWSGALSVPCGAFPSDCTPLWLLLLPLPPYLLWALSPNPICPVLCMESSQRPVGQREQAVPETSPGDGLVPRPAATATYWAASPSVPLGPCGPRQHGTLWPVGEEASVPGTPARAQAGVWTRPQASVLAIAGVLPLLLWLHGPDTAWGELHHPLPPGP